MKTPSDYDELIYKAVYIDSDEDKEKVYMLINHVIRDTWNEALDKAAKSMEFYVDEQSILKLKL